MKHSIGSSRNSVKRDVICTNLNKSYNSDCVTLIDKCNRFANKQELQLNHKNYKLMINQLNTSNSTIGSKYIKPSKPTAGKGHGCGSPAIRILPPLWMYSTATKKSIPSCKPRDISIKHHKKPKNIKNFKKCMNI